MKNSNLKDRMLGCLFGQAIGDALGLGSEFMDKNEVIKHYFRFIKISDYPIF